jgi:hypothetical protein
VYFWRTRALAEDLKAGRVPERQRMWYLFGQMVMLSSSVPVGFEFGEAWPSPLSAAATWLSMAAINAAGVLLCYEANRQGDNREFVNQFVCLSWPVTIRLLTLFIPALVGAASWVWWRGGDGDDRETGLVVLGLGFLFPALYYWRLRSHLRWVAATVSP